MCLHAGTIAGLSETLTGARPLGVGKAAMLGGHPTSDHLHWEAVVRLHCRCEACDLHSAAFQHASRKGYLLTPCIPTASPIWRIAVPLLIYVADEESSHHVRRGVIVQHLACMWAEMYDILAGVGVAGEA